MHSHAETYKRSAYLCVYSKALSEHHNPQFTADEAITEHGIGIKHEDVTSPLQDVLPKKG